MVVVKGMEEKRAGEVGVASWLGHSISYCSYLGVKRMEQVRWA